MNIVAMPETPMFVSLCFLGLACIIAARLGIEVLSRTCAYFIPLLIFILIVTQFLAMSQVHLNYIKPILGNGLTPVLKGAFQLFHFRLLRQ
jgi:spore germination protein KB